MGFGSFLTNIGKGLLAAPKTVYEGVLKPIGGAVVGGAQAVAKVPEYAWKEVLQPVGKGVFRGAEEVGKVTIGIGKGVVEDVVAPVFKPIINAGSEVYKDIVRPIAQGTGTALGGLGTGLANLNSTLLLAGGLVAVVVLLR